MKTNNYDVFFVLNNNCSIVKGAKRSLISNHFYDSIDILPLEIYDFIINNQGIATISQILEKYNNKEKEILLEYIEYLLKKNYISIITELEPDNLQKDKINEYIVPYYFTNCIIEINENSDTNLFFSKVKNDIPNLVLKIIFDITHDNLAKMIYSFNLSSVEYIELHLNFKNTIDIYKLINLFNIQQRLFKIILFNCEKSEIVYHQKDLSNYIIMVKEQLDEKTCGIIHPNLFSKNKLHYLESQNFNTCLNKKLSIDYDGNIKNCPSMKETFGNIKDMTIEEIYSKKNLKKYWNIKKDNISICKDCEFRHICTDCRAYIENPLDINSKPLKCGYDPYTAKWSDWATNPLKQKAIKYYGINNLTILD